MTRRLLTGLLLFAALMLSQVTVRDFADLSCDSAAHPLTATSTTARWIQLVAPAGNSQIVRWGGSDISSSKGAIIVPGAGQMLPPIPPATGGSSISTLYDLSKIYYLCTASDKLSGSWGL